MAFNYELQEVFQNSRVLAGSIRERGPPPRQKHIVKVKLKLPFVSALL